MPAFEIPRTKIPWVRAAINRMCNIRRLQILHGRSPWLSNSHLRSTANPRITIVAFIDLDSSTNEIYHPIEDSLAIYNVHLSTNTQMGGTTNLLHRVDDKETTREEECRQPDDCSIEICWRLYSPFARLLVKQR